MPYRPRLETPGQYRRGWLADLLLAMSLWLATALLALLLAAPHALAAEAEIRLSLSPDRAGAVPLLGRSLAEPAYIHIGGADGVRGVRWYLDDPEMQRPPLAADWSAPYDLAGSGADGQALPYDPAGLTPGWHTLTARLSMTASAAQVLRVRFQRCTGAQEATPAATPTPSPTPTPTPTATPSPMVGPVKWHPGQYAFSSTPDNPAQTAQALASPLIRGIQLRYTWVQLEPERGRYDFSGIEKYLADYRKVGKRLHLLLIAQNYGGRDCVPAYVRASEYAGGQVITARRCVPKYWEPAVMDRLIALYTALGKRFDAEPYFEAISTGETAIGKEARADPHYNNNGFVDQLIRAQDALAKAWPHTLVFVGPNWCPLMPRVIDSVYAKGLGIGGPDLIVCGEDETPAYSYYRDYRGRLPLEIGGQVGLINAFGCAAMPAIYDFALRDKQGLQVTHMDWSYPYGLPGISFDGTILPHIAAREAAQANTACPENIVKFRGGCAP